MKRPYRKNKGMTERAVGNFWLGIAHPSVYCTVQPHSRPQIQGISKKSKMIFLRIFYGSALKLILQPNWCLAFCKHLSLAQLEHTLGTKLNKTETRTLTFGRLLSSLEKSFKIAENRTFTWCKNPNFVSLYDLGPRLPCYSRTKNYQCHVYIPSFYHCQNSLDLTNSTNMECAITKKHPVSTLIK